MITLKKQGLYYLIQDEEFIEIYRDDEFITSYSLAEKEKAEKDFDELVGNLEIKEND